MKHLQHTSETSKTLETCTFSKTWQAGSTVEQDPALGHTVEKEDGSGWAATP
jgi:hypothetical protein